MPPSEVAGGLRFRSLPALAAELGSGDEVRVRRRSPLTGAYFRRRRAQELQETAAQLPAARAYSEIMAAVRRYSVTIIQGSTGTGKSTQVMQTVLEMQWYHQVSSGTVVQVCPIVEPLRDMHQRLEDEMGARSRIHLATGRDSCAV